MCSGVILLPWESPRTWWQLYSMFRGELLVPLMHSCRLACVNLQTSSSVESTSRLEAFSSFHFILLFGHTQNIKFSWF